MATASASVSEGECNGAEMSSIATQGLAKSLTEAITASLRQEIASAVREEREARAREVGELRELCEASRKSVEDLSGRLEAEELERCSKDADLHARLGTEISGLSRQLEVQMATLKEELEEKRAALQVEINSEHEERQYDMVELRATLDATWKQLLRRPRAEESQTKVRYFQDGVGNCKEFMGDVDDLHTLYDLAKEAVDQSSRVEAGIVQERRSRIKQFKELKRSSERFDHQFSGLRDQLDRVASFVRPKASSWTLAQLIEADPQWSAFLTHSDGLFSSDDRIDEPYKMYLGDVLPVMLQHGCSFKEAIGMLDDCVVTKVSSSRSSEGKVDSSESTESALPSPKKGMGSEISTDVEAA